MAASVNRVFIVGNLGRDPESRHLPSGTQVVTISVATEERKNKDEQPRTMWHTCSMFGKLAEIAEQYLRKGSQVFIEGRLAHREYENKEGQTVKVTEIHVDRMQMLGGRGDGGGESSSSSSGRNPYAERKGGGGSRRKPPPASGASDDDIPF